MDLMRKTLSMLLAVTIVITACPTSVLASTTDDTEDGYELISEVDESAPNSAGEKPRFEGASEIVETDGPMEDVDTTEPEQGKENDAPGLGQAPKNDDIVKCYGDYLYTVLANGGISICGYTGVPNSDTEGTHLKIPASIDGVAVTQVSEKAFANNDFIDTVLVPKSITSMGDSVFYHCTDLKAIAFCGAIPTLGATLLEGSNALEKVFALEDTAVSGLYDLLVADLGQKTANLVEVVTCEDLQSLNDEFITYTTSLDELLQQKKCNFTEETTAGESEEADDGTMPTTDGAGEDTPPVEGISVGKAVLPNANNGMMTVASEFETFMTGAVTDMDGLGISEVTVSVFDVTGNNYEFLSNTKTDISGIWTIEDAWIGDTYVVYYYKAGYQFSKNNIQVTAASGGSVLETVIATPMGIEGLVCNEADYTYTTDTTAETATITGYTGTDTAIQLPAELDGYPVTAVSNSVFKGNTTLETVVFSESIVSIGANAFENCTALKEVYLPNTLTKIYGYAFQGCTSIESMVLPDSVQLIGYRAFRNCAKLSSINYPLSWNSTYADYHSGQVFSGCSSLTSITVPEGVTMLPDSAFSEAVYLEAVVLPSTLTTINAYAFSGCTGITSITLPEGLTHIYHYAFQGCTSIESMVLPDSVQLIGYRAFQNCTKLSSINYPLSWNSTYADYHNGQVFSGCSSLTNITVPEGVTALPSYAFQGADYLKTVTLPETLTSVGAYAFSNCDAIRVISFPRGVSSLGNNVADGCASLRSLLIANADCSIGANILSNSPYATLYCAYNSYATVYAIENSIPFVQMGNETAGENNVLDYANSSYFADLESIAANGILSMTVTYAIKESASGSVSNMSLYLVLPENAELNEETLKLNNSICTNYTYDGNRTLTMPVTENAGTLKFSLKVTSQGRLFSYAALNRTKDGVTVKNIIGILNDEANVLTLNAPEIVAKNTVSVNGLAPASSVVTLYVNGVEQQTVTASKAGSWAGTVTIASPVDYKSYIVLATCTSNGATMQQSAEVTYRADEATMTSFLMYYNEHSTIKTYDLMASNATKPKVYFVPGTQFNFEVTFDHPEQINNLYVTSTRNNEVKYLEAVYDESKGAFITDGYFDDSDHRYVPGALSIEYTKKISAVSVNTSYDWDVFTDETVSRTDDTVVFGEITETDCYAQIDLGSVYANLQDVIIDASISVYDAATDGNLGDWLGVFKDIDTFSSYIVPGQNDEKYLLTMDYSDPYTYVMLVRDATGSKFVKLILKTATESTENLDTVWTLTQVSGVLSTTNSIAGILLKQHEIETDMDALRDEIWRTTYATPGQRQEALKQVDKLEKDQSYFALITTILPLIVASAPLAVGATMTAPAILFTGILGVFTAVAPMFWEIRTAHIKGEKLRVSFVVDPSGYVYDAATMERLEGVKATAYCIPYDESEDFWSTVPSTTAYGELWDASEYDQENPVYTNADGKYAWNVPEGWWRVKYEKDGYETVWSDWLTVPPPQTEVNIGMTPIVASGVAVSGTITSYSSNTDDVTVELVDSTGSTAYSVTVTGNSASYTLSNVAAGAYTMKVSKVNHVTRYYTVVVETVDLVKDVKICLLGDVTGDGRVTAIDYSRLLAHVNKTSIIIDEYTLLCADVTHDGEITATDYSRLLAHVTKVSLLW